MIADCCVRACQALAARSATAKYKEAVGEYTVRNKGAAEEEAAALDRANTVSEMAALGKQLKVVQEHTLGAPRGKSGANLRRILNEEAARIERDIAALREKLERQRQEALEMERCATSATAAGAGSDLKGELFPPAAQLHALEKQLKDQKEENEAQAAEESL